MKKSDLITLALALSVGAAACQLNYGYGAAKAETRFAAPSFAITETVDSSKYDSRDYGFVTPVKDQGNSNICWAYASVAASETSILRSAIDGRATDANLSLSPESLAYARHNRGADPLGNTPGEITGQNWYSTAGTPQYCAALLSQWCGPTLKNSPSTQNQFLNAEYHLNNAVCIRDGDIAELKEAIVKYGAVTYSYNNLRETQYYNPKNETSGNSYPHACTIIGWNDEIPASDFVPGGASRDGGWLVKNSYSSLPYFYLSYDNKCSEVYAFDFTVKDKYENNYFYDYSLNDGLNYTLNVRTAANVFEAKKGDGEDEYLCAVNVGIEGVDVDCTVKVYTDVTDSKNPESGKLAGQGKDSFGYGGFRTVELDTPVKIEKGTLFAVTAEVKNSKNNALIRFMNGGAKSCVFKNYWTGSPHTARIKAFTVCRESVVPSVPVKTDIIGAAISVKGKCVYSGAQMRPELNVAYEGSNLILNTDYEVSYVNNVNAGDATAVVKGKGNYTGEKSVIFKIFKAESPPVVPLSTIIAENAADVLGKVELPTGWNWENANAALDVGDNENLIAVYCDTHNYENSRKPVTVRRLAGEETQPDTPEPVPVPPATDTDGTSPPETQLPNDVQRGGQSYWWIALAVGCPAVAGGGAAAVTCIRRRKSNKNFKRD